MRSDRSTKDHRLVDDDLDEKLINDLRWGTFDEFADPCEFVVRCGFARNFRG